jgi:hypothetical protein
LYYGVSFVGWFKGDFHIVEVLEVEDVLVIFFGFEVNVKQGQRKFRNSMSYVENVTGIVTWLLYVSSYVLYGDRIMEVSNDHSIGPVLFHLVGVVDNLFAV